MSRQKGIREFTQTEAEAIYYTAYSQYKYPWHIILNDSFHKFMQLTEKAKCCQLELMMGNLVSQVASIIPPKCGVINMTLNREKMAYKQPLNTFTLNIGLPGK